MNKQPDIRSIGRQFQIHGEFLLVEPHGSGHINDTYRAAYDQGGVAIRYIHQRINHLVFKNPDAVMQNIQRVTTHIRQKFAGEADVTRRALTVVPTHDGALYYRDPLGNYWRTYVCIEKAHTRDTVENVEHAFEAARSFGRFQKLVTDLPAPRLHDTIPDFHNTPKRFAALEAAIAADAANRAGTAQKEIEFALHRKPMASVLVALQAAGKIPERITHNDTKFNNVMFDDATGTGLCVLDLDTVMPGLALYDFGDMVRSTTSPADEDERDLSKVVMQFPMFAALVRGYLEEAGEFLNKTEKQHLAFSGKLITFEIGLRFLTDHLAGDTYFKVHRPGHNLDRCRTQFKLVESIEQQEEKMTKLVEGVPK